MGETSPLLVAGGRGGAANVVVVNDLCTCSPASSRTWSYIRSRYMMFPCPAEVCTHVGGAPSAGGDDDMWSGNDPSGLGVWPTRNWWNVSQSQQDATVPRGCLTNATSLKSNHGCESGARDRIRWSFATAPRPRSTCCADPHPALVSRTLRRTRVPGVVFR